MALTALIRLSEQLLNETVATQGAGTPQTPVNAAGNTTNSPAAPAARDQFVPSTQNNSAAANAEAAGLFRVAQFSLFTAAADSLLAQTAPARQRNAASQPAPAAGVLFEPAAQGAGVINPAAKQATDLAAATHSPAAANANANNTNTTDAATALPQPVAAATTTANATSAGTANATAAGAASVQAELQTGGARPERYRHPEGRSNRELDQRFQPGSFHSSGIPARTVRAERRATKRGSCGEYCGACSHGDGQ